MFGESLQAHRKEPVIHTTINSAEVKLGEAGEAFIVSSG